MLQTSKTSGDVLCDRCSIPYHPPPLNTEERALEAVKRGEERSGKVVLELLAKVASPLT